jgi:hypothetical protein
MGPQALSFDLDDLDSSVEQQLVERRDRAPRATLGIVGEDDALLGARKRDKESSRCFRTILLEAPAPSVVVETDEDDGVMFEPLALMMVISGTA